MCTETFIFAFFTDMIMFMYVQYKTYTNKFILKFRGIKGITVKSCKVSDTA